MDGLIHRDVYTSHKYVTLVSMSTEKSALQPPILLAIAIDVLPAINLLNIGLRSFSNFDERLMIASSAAGLCFIIAAIFVFAFMIMLIVL